MIAPSPPFPGAIGASHLRVYDSVAERPMADVDVLVLEAWPEALAVLADLGLEEQARADHALAFGAPGGGTLELHHSVASCPGLHPLDAEGLWQRSSTAEGQVRRQPAAEDLLVQLALHAAFQHGLVLTLVQYLDFGRLLAAERPSPERVLEAAAASRATPALAASSAASLQAGIRETTAAMTAQARAVLATSASGSGKAIQRRPTAANSASASA